MREASHSQIYFLLWVCGEIAYHIWLLPSCSQFESEQTHQIFGTIAGRSSIGLLILRRGFDSLWSYHLKVSRDGVIGSIAVSKTVGCGSSPYRGTMFLASSTAAVQMTVNHWVAGSIPASPAILVTPQVHLRVHPISVRAFPFR